VRVVINAGAYVSLPRQDGSFTFHAVSPPRRAGCPCRHEVAPCLLASPWCAQIPPGSYLLEVYDTQRVWPTVRVDVSAKTQGKLRALMTHNRLPLPLPLPLEPLVAKPSFFEKREGFKISSILMNPMAIMMGVTLLIMVVMPKMMANMDPEQLKEMQQMQSGGLADLLNPEKLKEKQQAALKEAKKK
jgi:hypothetical protein